MKRRTMCVIMCILFNLLNLFFQAEPSKGAEVLPAHINAGFSGISGTQTVLWYAFEKGLFKKYNLDVELVAITSGSTAVMALIAGDVDFCQIAGPAVVNAVVAGENLVIIGGLFNTYLNSLMVAPEIKTIEDLRGKALAISKPGSASDTATRVMLQHLGLEPDKEVAILSTGGQGARLAAMEIGEIVGTLLTVPITAKAREKGYHELLHLSSLNLAYQHTGIVTTREYIDKNPEMTSNFMKAIVAAIASMKQDRVGTMQVMAKYLLLDMEDDAPALTEAYDTLILENLPRVPYPTLDGIQTLLTLIEAENTKAKNFRPEDVVDLSIVQQLEKSGFISELYR